MADTRKLTMVFTLDNGDDFKYNLAAPKDELTKSEVDVVMQKMIDTQAIIKIIIKQQRLRKHISQLLHKMF